ncbi:MAG: DEAD/DEAH box helicase [Oscillospiraceae bacterium]|nr:DEAD/DEAH box helicase [Oscillospiraceae bacterium]
MQSPIEKLLIQDYDQLKRDYNGSVVYEKRLSQVADNLISHPALDSSRYQTYDAFMNALLSDGSLTNARIFSIPSHDGRKHRYVGDVLTKQIWTSWRSSDNVYISAGTGRGKNTFIKMELLKHIGDAKVVIFENRESLMQQQIMDMVSEIDPDALKYQDISQENMVIFGGAKNIMLISYQAAALKCAMRNGDFLNFCQNARYLVFDEAHYILDDAYFNKGINFFLNTFLPQNAFPFATKIFMSGSMEEFYTFSQTMSPFRYVNCDGEISVADVILLQKWLLAVPNTHLPSWKLADVCEDGRLDVFDLCLLKRMLLNS